MGNKLSRLLVSLFILINRVLKFCIQLFRNIHVTYLQSGLMVIWHLGSIDNKIQK